MIIWNAISKTDETRLVLPNQIIPISVYATQDVGVYFNEISPATKIGTIIIENGFGFGCYNIGTTDKTIILTLDDIPLPGYANKLKLVQYKSYNKRPKILYFLNKSGAWDWMIFSDFVRETRSDNKSSYDIYLNDYNDKGIYESNDGEIVRLKLFAPAYHPSFNSNIESLITSNIVYDENNERVRLLDTNYRVDQPEETQTITIEYISKNTINF